MPRPRLRSSVVLAALVIGGCVQALSVRSSVLDPSSLERAECVAVLPFENRTGQAAAGELVAQEVASALLTSERYNVLQPGETEELLRLLAVKNEATASVAAAQRLGEVLGVQALLTGTVTAFESRDLTRRTPAAEPVVGFAARLVEAKSGRVLWSATASNFD